MKLGLELCPLKCIHGFTKIRPSDLVFDSTRPFINCGLAFIKINIMTKFHEDWIKTMPSGVYSWFY